MARAELNRALSDLKSLIEETCAAYPCLDRDDIAEVLDDFKWDITFALTKDTLQEMAERARKESNAGLTEPFDYDKL